MTSIGVMPDSAAARAISAVRLFFEPRGRPAPRLLPPRLLIFESPWCFRFHLFPVPLLKEACASGATGLRDLLGYLCLSLVLSSRLCALCTCLFASETRSIASLDRPERCSFFDVDDGSQHWRSWRVDVAHAPSFALLCDREAASIREVQLARDSLQKQCSRCITLRIARTLDE